MNREEKSVIEDIIGRLDDAEQIAHSAAVYRKGSAAPSLQSVVRDIKNELLELVGDGQPNPAE